MLVAGHTKGGAGDEEQEDADDCDYHGSARPGGRLGYCRPTEAGKQAGQVHCEREAGDPSKPAIVLLHGFPSSSSQFRDLIPRLEDRFHVIAPDYPGMGFSEAPDPTVLQPTFDDVARVIDAFIAQRAPGPLILYLHDIGGPIGMRIATARPEHRRPDFSELHHYSGGLEPRSPESLRAARRP
jgi:pimeloyl-ACP methyl ester carboxylesterase